MDQRLGLTPRTGRVALAAAIFAITLASCTNASGHAAQAGSARSVQNGAANTAPAPTTGIPDQLVKYYKQTVHWSDCGSGFQCASISVPLDYSKPTGAVISLAINRKPASDQAHRIGSSPPCVDE